MLSNGFPVNAAGVNRVTLIGDPVIIPVSVVDCTERALRHESLIDRDAHDGVMRPLEGNSTYDVRLALKGVKVVNGGTPQQKKVRRGYVSTCALERVNFDGEIEKGFIIETDEARWHVESAVLEYSGGTGVRWALDLQQS